MPLHIVLSLLFSPLWMIAVKRVHLATQQGILGLRDALLHGPSSEDDLVTHPVVKGARRAVSRFVAATPDKANKPKVPPSAAE